MRVHSLELVFEIKPLTGLCKGTGKSSSSEGLCCPADFPRDQAAAAEILHQPLRKTGLPSAH